MLIGIPSLMSPQLMRVLMEMGHGDELVVADANFPVYAIARGSALCEVVHGEGAGVAEWLDALLKLLPLDYAVASPVIGMSAPEGADMPPVHAEVLETLLRHGGGADKLCFLPRFEFYERARGAYAVLATSETRRFANLIVKKGVIG